MKEERKIRIDMKINICIKVLKNGKKLKMYKVEFIYNWSMSIIYFIYGMMCIKKIYVENFINNDVILQLYYKSI